ncbi:MAG: amidohydrolase [Chloroflexi bacterium]|nr:amidohydrolase [Chloroflexota bacterium]
MAIALHSDVEELREELIALRRDLHRHPELAFAERRTAALVAERLRSWGFAVQAGVARTGVIGVLDMGGPGKTLMLRADMDALPIHETPGRPYGSTNQGAMHACGHDAHVAVALTTAGLLAKHRSQLRGRLKVVFQPAEEIVAGAKLMLEEGLMDTLPPDRVLGFHCWPTLAAGKVGVHPGYMWAAVDQVKLLVRGVGAHGGTPHLGADPLLAGAHIVVALQSLFSREISTFQPALFTQGIFRAGSLYNIIPAEAEIWGSCRNFDPQVRDFMHRRIREIAEGVAATFRCTATMELGHGSPALWNDPDATADVQEAASQAVGAGNVVDIGQSAVGDDMAYFLQKAPGCYFLLGVGNPQQGIDASLHSPQFDIDESALPVAAETLAGAAIAYLGQP